MARCHGLGLSGDAKVHYWDSKGPQSLAVLSDRILLEHLKSLCSTKSVKIRQ